MALVLRMVKLTTMSSKSARKALPTLSVRLPLPMFVFTGSRTKMARSTPYLPTLLMNHTIIFDQKRSSSVKTPLLAPHLTIWTFFTSFDHISSSAISTPVSTTNSAIWFSKMPPIGGRMLAFPI
ncbi:hypothetical protein EJ02DRAFT_480005 [Clathrospora elynae]|uniref:Uncharacterized protein n=1 Tax=Clathrospora elynae TaxID=706981 RepID=A0A6A5S9J0_9PLEO|nr:hypothetical protein EJ02DRAFT_480005 [Clathrospora elynae]